ncbi:MAG: GTPase Era [Nitrospirota bacterium]|nr:GTPase Era [Nitrospirota bacterium]
MDQSAGTGQFRSGYIGIVGRPNVGKSTLLNALLGEKVAIITNRPQTTRTRILGIKNLPGCQMIFLDTPGIHKPMSRLNEIMVETAWKSAKDADVLLVVIDAVEGITRDDREIIDIARELEKPTLLIINKVDLVHKPTLLTLMKKCSELHDFVQLVPISALRFENLDLLVKLIPQYLPEGPAYFPDDQFTDQTERFMATEIIREKAILQTHQELPYVIAVELENWHEESDRDLVNIAAVIYVEKDSQKAIVIGSGGLKLREIGRLARLDIEKLIHKKVFLELWVKEKGSWRDDERALSQFGYEA